MAQGPGDTIRAILANHKNIDVIRDLVAAGATYVSLNHDNPELKKLMPWAGTRHDGAEGVVENCHMTAQYFNSDGFNIEEIVEQDNKAAAFGRFSYRSKSLAKSRNNVIEYMFLEEREVENLVPIEVLRRIVPIDTLIDHCNATVRRNMHIWPYLDLKNGTTLNWLSNRDHRTRAFWINVDRALKKQNARCSCCEDDGDSEERCTSCSLPGMGPAILDKCIAYLRDTSPAYLLKLLEEDLRWEKLAGVAFDFSVVPLGDRSAS